MEPKSGSVPGAEAGAPKNFTLGVHHALLSLHHSAETLLPPKP